MTTLVQKAASPLESISQLIALLVRCKDITHAARLYPIKDALERLDCDHAIALWETIPMTGMDGFSDLILCAENGHHVQDYEADNRQLTELLERTTAAISNLDAFLNAE